MRCSGLQQPQKQSGRTGFAGKSNRQNERSVGPVVRTKRENFFPQSQTKFLICSVYFGENCFT